MNQAYLIQTEDQLWCDKNGVRITCPGDWDYPPAFIDLEYRPAALFYIGQPVWLTHPLLSVVGSRSPSEKNSQWLESTLQHCLAKINFAIVSGGARGIDQLAHKSAIANSRPTVVFLPSGLRVPYPRELQEWVQPIVQNGGCIVSQFLPSAPMHKRYFRERNYLIAAISPLTLVAECRRRSGTLLTANFCLELDRELVVMPTGPYDLGLGGLDLICDSGATPVRDGVDLELAIARFSQLIQVVRHQEKICRPNTHGSGQMSFSCEGLKGDLF